MNVTFYLIISSEGKVEVRKNVPSLAWNQVSVSMNMELPDELFTKPLIHADIVVPSDSINPHVITPKIKSNFKKAIEQSSGLEVRLTMVEDRPDVIKAMKVKDMLDG